MDGTRARRSEANPDLTGELRVSARHERRHFFMPHLHVLHCPIGSIKRAHDPVNSVAGISVNAFQAPFVDSLD